VTPCATLRVGNETRAWAAGRVLFFDDSFEHEVVNRCDAERVVFQLVFEHPGFADAVARHPEVAAARPHGGAGSAAGH
jgi:aspartyl/asparaginyl beta-hydroxylase (cupin superfamily)